MNGPGSENLLSGTRTMRRKRRPAALSLVPLDCASVRDQAYARLKQAIVDTDIYGEPDQLWLDETQLTKALGVSRTPVREAIFILEHEGLLRTVPRRGICIVRKSKREAVELIHAWAALESMAARLATSVAPDTAIAELRQYLVRPEAGAGGRCRCHFSDVNLDFHSAVTRLGASSLLCAETASLLIHVRAVRKAISLRSGRTARSLIDHHMILAALEARDVDLAERLVRQHTLDLSAYVDRHGDFLG